MEKIRQHSRNGVVEEARQDNRGGVVERERRQYSRGGGGGVGKII